MGGQGSKSNESSVPVYKNFPGAWGNTDYSISNPLASGSVALTAKGAGEMTNSDYGQELHRLLMGGSPELDTSDTNLLNQIMDVTAGRSAVSGLGAPTQASLAQTVAPTLEQMWNDQITTLLGAEGQQFMQTMGAEQALQSLAELAMPQVAGGNATEGKSRSYGMQVCCFIFMEAYDGRLLDVVRRYRDEHVTIRNRRGYYRLADILVPMMRRSRAIKRLVRLCMTDPMVSYGRWFYGDGRAGILFAPVAHAWLGLFGLLGGRKQYVRKNGEVI